MTLKEFKNYVHDYPIGTRWMRFYIYIRFPIGIVWGGLQMISFFADMTYFNYSSTVTNILFVFLCLDVVQYALDIITFRQMRQQTMMGYYLNIVDLFFGAFMVGLNIAIQSAETWFSANFFAMLLLGFGICGLAFVIPNLIYFSKRIDLFNGEYTPEDEYEFIEDEFTEPAMVVKAEPTQEELELTSLYEELKSINNSIRTAQDAEPSKSAIALSELEGQKQRVLSQIQELEAKPAPIAIIPPQQSLLPPTVAENPSSCEDEHFSLYEKLESIEAQKQEVLKQIQALESVSQRELVPDQTTSPNIPEEPIKCGSLSPKVKAIITLGVIGTLIVAIAIAFAAIYNQSKKEEEYTTEPTIGQTVYWNNLKYHNTPNCPAIYRENRIQEREYTRDIKDSELCSWCWEHPDE